MPCLARVLVRAPARRSRRPSRPSTVPSRETWPCRTAPSACAATRAREAACDGGGSANANLWTSCCCAHAQTGMRTHMRAHTNRPTHARADPRVRTHARARADLSCKSMRRRSSGSSHVFVSCTVQSSHRSARSSARAHAQPRVSERPLRAGGGGMEWRRTRRRERGNANEYLLIVDEDCGAPALTRWVCVLARIPRQPIPAAPARQLEHSEYGWPLARQPSPRSGPSDLRALACASAE